jgi:hypothetical protein
MIKEIKIFIGVGISVSMLLFACEKKSQETVRKPVTETIAIDYSYNVSAFKRNVNWSTNDETWQPVTVGLGIPKGSLVETGEASAATLNGTLGDIVMLGERAKVELLIEKLQKQADGRSLAMRGVSLLRGTVRFTIAKGIGTFIVQTPSARVNVKGTDFIVTYDEKSGSTDVRVREGSVVVDDKKNLQKTYSLSKGQTLVGAGTEHPVQRVMTPKETAVFEEFVSSGQSEQPKTPKETPEAIHSRPTTESHSVSSTGIDTERVNSQTAVDNERTTSQQKIDSVRTDYYTKTQAEKDTFANRKAVAQATVDSTKSAAQSALDAERAKFKKATGSLKSPSGGSADDLFDELDRSNNGK